jgi:hypothetical protein
MDGRMKAVPDEIPLVVRQLDHRAYAGNVPDARVRLNGTNKGIRAGSIGYRF